MFIALQGVDTCQHFWLQAYDINNFIFSFTYKTVGRLWAYHKSFVFLVLCTKTPPLHTARFWSAQPAYLVYIRMKVVQITQKSGATWYSYLTTPFIYFLFIYFCSETAITLPLVSDRIAVIYRMSGTKFFYLYDLYS